VDPVTKGLGIVLFILSLEVDAHFWSQLVSFGLVGMLAFTQVRGFLITIMKIFKATSTPLSSNTMVLLLAEIMGMYFVSSMILMRMNIPQEYREILNRLLGEGDIDFQFFSPLV